MMRMMRKVRKKSQLPELTPTVPLLMAVVVVSIHSPFLSGAKPKIISWGSPCQGISTSAWMNGKPKSVSTYQQGYE